MDQQQKDIHSIQPVTPKAERSDSETVFLEGPKPHFTNLIFLLKVFGEFWRGLLALRLITPCITVFGSARFEETHPYYQMTRDVAKGLVKLGFAVMTGGGPGIMEAANRGAQEGGGLSVGCNIKLPKEQVHNPYLDKWVTFNHFFVRKVLLTKFSYGFIVMPGGYGTMDEFFEAITLIQTGKIKKFPVVLMGRDYYEELFNFLQKMEDEDTISPLDIELFLFTDSVEEAVDHIRKHAIENFGLVARRIKKRAAAAASKGA